MQQNRFPFQPKEGLCRYPWFWLGTFSMAGHGYGRSDADEARDTLECALDKGIRFFDTAGFYGKGLSEQLLAHAIRGSRDEVFISSKGGLFWEGNDVQKDGSYEGLKYSLHESLERLGTDYIDLFQLHWPDPETPLTESISALRSFKKEGLIRYWGIGNWTEAQLMSYIEPGEYVPHQVHFNPLVSNMDVLKAGASESRCFNCVISPLEKGLLTGASYTLGKKDHRRKNVLFYDDEVAIWLAKFKLLCDRAEISPAVATLLWVLHFNMVHAVIVGPRRLDQLNELLVLLSIIETNALNFSGIHEFFWRQVLSHVFGQDLWTHLHQMTSALSFETES